MISNQVITRLIMVTSLARMLVIKSKKVLCQSTHRITWWWMVVGEITYQCVHYAHF